MAGVWLSIVPETAYRRGILQFCTVLCNYITRQHPDSGWRWAYDSSKDGGLKTRRSAVWYCTALRHRPALRPKAGRGLSDDSSKDSLKTTYSAAVHRALILHHLALRRKCGRRLVEDSPKDSLKTRHYSVWCLTALLHHPPLRLTSGRCFLDS